MRRGAIVVGSLHMDLIAHAPRLPGRGESVTGGTFTMAAGGKGGNQACQLARLGIHTFLITRLGRDMFGDELLRATQAQGVDGRYVVRDAEAATGASTIFASDSDYQSIIAPGAAARLNASDIDAALPAFDDAHVLLAQLELPPAVTIHAARRARERGVRVVLNASPVPDDDPSELADLWPLVDLLVVNRVEAGHILGREVGETRSAMEAAQALRTRYGVHAVIVTLGSEGAIGADPTGQWHVPALPARVVDTVGAGDAFLGAATWAFIQDRPIADLLDLGVAAGAIAVERHGGSESLPTLTEIEHRLGLKP